MPHLKQLLPKLALGPASLVYDLGSGDGRVLLAAAKNGSPAVGFEINPVLFCWSWLRVRCKRLSKKISLCPVSFWQQSLRPASIIFAFLLPEHMAKLEKKLEKEIKSGTVVITYLASLPHWKAYLSENGYKLYKAPAIHGMMS